MRKVLLLPLAFGAALYGGLLDFRTLGQAKEAYGAGRYGEAAALYESVEEKNDALRFNLGDAYYKEAKYDEAIKQYEQVQTPELRAKALHNLGNAQARGQKIDEAIASYEEALRLSDDEDTRYNLELLKEKKEQQDNKDQQKDQKQEQQENGDSKDQKKQDDQKQEQQKDQQQNGDDQQEKESGDNSGQKDEKQAQDKAQQQEDEAKKNEKAEAKEDEASGKEQQEQNAMKQSEAKEVPISEMQERKYEKMLDKRGIRTLMVPLQTEGGRDEETTAW